jgi:hypothetical protein
MASSKVTSAEINKAFYDSYTDPKTKTLDARLVDAKTGKPRPLTIQSSDAQFREEWSKIRQHLLQLKNCAPKKGGPKVGAPVVPCPAAGKKPDAPAYDQVKWNDGGPIQTSTNCYAYAMNSSTGHPANDKPQPGEKSGTSGAGDENTCPNVTARVVADGKPANPKDTATIRAARQCPYQKQNHLTPPDRKGFYLVALVVTSAPKTAFDPVSKTYNISDYHWYRQDDSGNWSGKPGHGGASDKDASGKTITNPETCDRDSKSPGPGGTTIRINYDVFCGYFYVKSGGVQVGS